MQLHRDLLKTSSLKSTPSRLAILEVLASEHHPFSIDQVISELRKRKTKGSLTFTTIYRSLVAMSGKGILHEVDLGDGLRRFELVDPDHHHHHVVCERCEAVTSIEACAVKKLEDHVKKLGFTEIRHRLEFFGICKSCRKSLA